MVNDPTPDEIASESPCGPEQAGSLLSLLEGVEDPLAELGGDSHAGGGDDDAQAIGLRTHYIQGLAPDRPGGAKDRESNRRAHPSIIPSDL